MDKENGQETEGEVNAGGSEQAGNAEISSDVNTDLVNDLNGCQIFGYGIGHFYNDLCASMWFTYLLLFLEKVVNIRSAVAGLIMLIGQKVVNIRSAVAGLIMLIGQSTDALSTALIGVVSDWTSAPLCLQKCGQRKSWHVVGTLLVTFSFPFIYNRCFLCNNATTDWAFLAWYAPFVMVFQIGWAAVQISHLALLPELTSDDSRRTTMNSVRYGSTVVANLVNFAVISLLLHFDDAGSAIGPNDLAHFTARLFTQTLFYTVTKEPPRSSRFNASQQLGILHSFKTSLLRWMCRLELYQVGVLYVLCRLYINLSQVYFPFYITHIRNLSKVSQFILFLVSKKKTEAWETRCLRKLLKSRSCILYLGVNLSCRH
ncbi:unnamed protein product [Gongylonema pulchrum]|uniref:G_PROTEIN_RECEP_F1_2 domain-containing protein n=1 Tax=Gongylonema pulchrum TaxID=637853 RepID=A0A183DTV6_9BILA|nr:unnamed protein product [Gongylonema pulchrum]